MHGMLSDQVSAAFREEQRQISLLQIYHVTPGAGLITNVTQHRGSQNRLSPSCAVFSPPTQCAVSTAFMLKQVPHLRQTWT